MTRKGLVTSLLAISLGCTQFGVAATLTQESTNQYTPSQIRELRRTAHTPAQYDLLAEYYDKQQKKYSDLASVEHEEWLRRSQNVTSIAAKYPRPADSARNLYQYYVNRADDATKLSSKYHRLANPNAPK
jgi:hypothetical protein